MRLKMWRTISCHNGQGKTLKHGLNNQRDNTCSFIPLEEYSFCIAMINLTCPHMSSIVSRFCHFHTKTKFDI